MRTTSPAGEAFPGLDDELGHRTEGRRSRVSLGGAPSFDCQCPVPRVASSKPSVQVNAVWGSYFSSWSTYKEENQPK